MIRLSVLEGPWRITGHEYTARLTKPSCPLRKVMVLIEPRTEINRHTNSKDLLAWLGQGSEKAPAASHSFILDQVESVWS